LFEHYVLHLLYKRIIFLQNYGTHLYSSAVFGGRFFIGGDKYDRPHVTPTMTTNELFESVFNAYTQIHVYFKAEGGRLRNDKPISTWMDSVERSPVIVRGT